jgi:phage gp36-like protein
MTVTDIDPAIAEMVEQVTNRFGIDGLDQLILLARQNRVDAEAALRELSDTASSA